MLKKKHTSRFWECDGQFCLMTRKGVYPYEYMDSWKKFEEISLPRKDAFYSRLNTKGISDQTLNIPSKFGITWRKKPSASVTIPT